MGGGLHKPILFPTDLPHEGGGALGMFFFLGTQFFMKRKLELASNPSRFVFFGPLWN